MGKYTESKKRPVIMTIKTEEKKKEIFRNLQKLRRSDENITITHDLTQKQRKELQELISEAKRKEECDISVADPGFPRGGAPTFYGVNLRASRHVTSQSTSKNFTCNFYVIVLL